jgi:hypothetical protein
MPHLSIQDFCNFCQLHLVVQIMQGINHREINRKGARRRTKEKREDGGVKPCEPKVRVRLLRLRGKILLHQNVWDRTLVRCICSGENSAWSFGGTT